MPTKAIVSTLGLLAANPSTAFVRQPNEISLLQQDADNADLAPAERGPIEWVKSLMGGGEHADENATLEDTCDDTKEEEEETENVESLFLKGDALRVSSGDHIGKEVEAETFLQDDNMWRVTTMDGKKVKVKASDLQKKLFETRIGPDGKAHTKAQFEKARWHDEWKEAEKSPEMRYNAVGQAWVEEKFVKHYGDCAWKKWNQAPSVEPEEPKGQSLLQQDAEQIGIAPAERGPIDWVKSLMGGGEHADENATLEDTCDDEKNDTDSVESLFLKGDALRVSSGDHIGKDVEAETFLQDDNMWRVTTMDGKKVKVKASDLQKRLFEMRIGPDSKAHTKAQFEKARWHDEWKEAEKSPEMRYNAIGQAWIEEKFVKHYGDCAWKKWNRAPSVEPEEPSV